MAIADTRARLSDLGPAEDAYGQPPAAPRRGWRTLGSIAFVVAGAAFVLVQDLLALHDVNVLRILVASEHLGGVPPGMLSTGRVLTETALEAAVLYLGFAGAGIVLALLGRRALFAIPALAYVTYGIAFGAAHLPQPIGTRWGFSCASGCSTWYSNASLGAVLDLLLVLLPAAVVALRVSGTPWPGRRDWPVAAGIGVALGATVVAYRTAVIVNGSAAVPETIAVASFALLAGTAGRWWPWAHGLVALALSGSISMLVSSAFYPDVRMDVPGYFLTLSLPLLAVALVAGSWHPIASALRRGRTRPLGLFAAANVLNVADAGLTAVAVSSGKAQELNPFVIWMGLPAKLLLVGGLTWFLYRRRPSSLIWPAAALLLVLCYHLSGLIVNH